MSDQQDTPALRERMHNLLTQSAGKLIHSACIVAEASDASLQALTDEQIFRLGLLTGELHRAVRIHAQYLDRILQLPHPGAATTGGIPPGVGVQ